MATLAIDPMNDAGLWVALQADAATPSLDLSIANDIQIVRFGVDGKSGRLSGTTAAGGHLLRRSFGTLDLTEYEDLQLAVRSDRAADGSVAAPFFLELKLGSAAVSVDDPANDWHRYLPIVRQNTWENVLIHLGDLDPAIRSGLTVIQLRCIDASRAFSLHMDDVMATRDEMTADVDAALLARLHDVFDLAGTPVPADVRLVGSAVAPAVPSIQLLHYGTNFSNERTNQSEARSDFAEGGYRLRGPSAAYDLFYAVEALATTRLDQARVLDFALRALGPRGNLVVSGNELPFELVLPSEQERLRVSGLPGDRPLIYLRVLARQRSAVSHAVRSVRQVLVDSGFKAA